MNLPLQKISDPLISSSGINLFLLRLDQVHSHISGNKWFKLKYNLEEAKKQNKEGILTFGGAYSNHIAATAAAGKEYGLRTIGIIRGDELTPDENSTLRFAKECGMELHFVSREEYKRLTAAGPNSQLPNYLIPSSPNYYLLPEGGTNSLAIKGCAEILSHIDIPFDFVCCPVGTGGTLAGIISSLKEEQKAIGFSVLKNGVFLKNDVQALLPFPSGSWDLITQYDLGGYAKHTPELLKFISDFETANNIPLEQVYTGKMMYGIYDLIRKKHFPENSTVIAVHTGGLQGKL
jgi:1-aminocyclopropane-1-carboxylate deaminase